jgi:regulator of RNase E activity RraA
VEVFGRRVEPGTLIHADKHGFLAVPQEDEAGLLDAARFMDANECDTFISAARSCAGRSTPEILAALDAATVEFARAAARRFGREGEWSASDKTGKADDDG